MTQTGLDELVEQAMGRKLIPTQQEAAADTRPTREDSEPIPTDVVPDATFAFAVNGVRCVLTIHVEAGGKVTVPHGQAGATKSGVKVKGVRGRSEPASAAPETSDSLVGEVGPDWVEHPVVGLTKTDWLCPKHGKAVFKTSAVTGRIFTVCGEPDCSEVAPK